MQMPRLQAEARQAGGGWQRTTLVLLSGLLVAGAWVRFNDRIATALPALAAPDTVLADAQFGGLVELALLPPSATAEAVATMGLPPGDAAALTEALRRGRLRLARMPLFDTGALPETGPGRGVQVSAGGYSRAVRLTRQPVIVTLPVGPAGSVAFRTSSADGVSIGALTMNGPVILPPLSAGQRMLVGIVAQ